MISEETKKWLVLSFGFLKRANEKSAMLKETLSALRDAQHFMMLEREREKWKDAIERRETILRYTKHSKKRQENERLLKMYRQKLAEVEKQMFEIVQKYAMG